MTLIIVILLLLGYVVIATGHLTGVNKAAIAIFIGTVGWVVYISYGTDFVMARHPQDYEEFLGGDLPSSDAVKYYIYNNVFVPETPSAYCGPLLSPLLSSQPILIT